MKSLYLQLGITCILFVTISWVHQVPTIKATEAANNIGKTVMVCDTLTNVFTSTKSDKAPTLLDLGGRYPNNVFTAVVFKDEAAKFSYQLSTLHGKAVCITGTIKDYKGNTEIIIDDEKQIVVR